MRASITFNGFSEILLLFSVTFLAGFSHNARELDPAGSSGHSVDSTLLALPQGTWFSFGSVRRGCDGPIDAAVTMANGDLILGGRFSACGGVSSKGLIRWDGARWYTVGGDRWVGDVRALAASGNDLYVAGNGAALNVAEGGNGLALARWDGLDWHSFGTGFDNQLDAPVNAVVINGSELIVGGEFTGLYSQPGTLSHVARWSAGAWLPLGSTASNGVDGTIHAIAKFGNTIYVGGAFINASGVAANRVARWNGNAWSSLGTGAQNGFDGTVLALAANGAELVAGGAFQRAGGQIAGGIARWNGAQWIALGSNPAGVTGTVRALLVDSGQITVGGALSFAGSLSVNNVARWTGSAWTAMGGGVGNSSASSTDTLQALALWNGQAYVFGEFTQSSASVTNRAARWNGTAWLPLIDPSDTTIMTGEVNAMASNGTDMYVAGSISQVGNLDVNNIARWNGTAWSKLGSGINGPVFALALDGESLYAGGMFSTAGGQVTSNLARWDGSAWHAVGSAGAEGTNGQILSLAAGNGSLFVGGMFTNAGGAIASNIASYRNGIWSSLGSGTDNKVHALSLDSNYLYAGGQFLSAGGVAASYIARWNGTQWSNLPNGFDNGVNSTVRSLHRVANHLYVGGQFTQAGPLACVSVAIWDGVTWISPDGGLSSPGVVVRDFSVLEGSLYAGTSDGATFVWTGTYWSVIGSGSWGEQRALASLGTRLYIGGSLAGLEGIQSKGIVGFTPYRIFKAGFETAAGL